ncbi:MAG: glutamine synthetase III [Chlamydiota bacterium]|nr:glutamine synthetase III [Chlamydiota bacterium]
MGNPRFDALETSGERNFFLRHDIESYKPTDSFGIRVFNRNTMQQMLPREIFENIVAATEGREKIKPQYADSIAMAMKEWAVKLGATHYCHWFQPLTGMSAEKHDAFIEWGDSDAMIDKFSGSQLIQGEPDASSFPSGGLRRTFEARGYTGWDPSSPVFVWKAGNGITLCIPSIFFSWKGAVLDNKIPLLRSDKKINEATMRLLKLTGIKANYVYSTLGTEQEFFVIDRALRNFRPDLVLLGRTVVGAPSPKGQELQDHYFGNVKDRILCFMHDFEEEALELGIPLKTRHNEVAPAQHEVAPVFEKSSVAVDHNILLMEIMRHTALKHNLACLLHEKPFQDLNGSGKHCNWSLSTDTGINLLNPTDTPENNLHFLILLTAVVHGIHKHAKLLRASIGSAGNDFRLGGHEAPPAIMSVYLGTELDTLLNNIEKEASHSGKGKGKYDLGILVIPELSQDNTDRNRTSPFAFTGNKFEFRAVGSMASPAMPVTVLNLVVAESLNEIIDSIEHSVKDNPAESQKALHEAVIPVLRKYIIASKSVRFEGDNYSAEWAKEAEKRGLTNIRKSIDSFEALKNQSTVELFEGILTENELISRFKIAAENYALTMNIEAKLILELFNTQILPVSLKHQKLMAKSLLAVREALNTTDGMEIQQKLLSDLVGLINQGIMLSKEVESLRDNAEKLDIVDMAHYHSEKVFPKCSELREVCDSLEQIVDDAIWPLPKYRELLYMV